MKNDIFANSKIQPQSPRGSRKKLFIFFLATLSLCSLILFSGCSKKTVEEELTDALESGTYIEGVSINDIDVSGKTLEEARTLVSESLSQKKQNATITLTYGDQIFDMDLDSLNLSSDIETVLIDAMALGRDGTASENKDTIQKTKEEKFNFPVTLDIDEASISQKLGEIAETIDKAPEDPAVLLNEESGKLEFEEGTPGQALDQIGAITAVKAAVNARNFPASVPLTVNLMQPTSTIEEVKARTTLIAKFSTSFENNAKSERVENIVLGAKKINGTKLNIGEKFSFNKIVGPRDAKNGWQMAATIVNGNKFEDDYGGGICQVSTTLYVAAAKADLNIVDRQKHSIPSSYVPYGMDATVAYGSKDFVFSNNKDYPIYIFATVSTGSKKIEVSIYGPPLEDADSIKLRSEVIEEIEPEEEEIVEDATAQPGSKEVLIKRRKGYKVEVFKDYIENGDVVKSEKMYTDTYRSERGVTKVGVATVADDPSAQDIIIPEENDDNSGNDYNDNVEDMIPDVEDDEVDLIVG